MIGDLGREEYRFFKHFDYGLLREVRGQLWFAQWQAATATWEPLTGFNPFTASMSLIAEGRARELVGTGDLYGPVVDPPSGREARGSTS